MSTIDQNDEFLVQRGTDSFKVKSSNLMSTIQDTDVMLVNRGDDSYQVTCKDVKDQLGSSGGQLPPPSGPPGPWTTSPYKADRMERLFYFNNQVWGTRRFLSNPGDTLPASITPRSHDGEFWGGTCTGHCAINGINNIWVRCKDSTATAFLEYSSDDGYTWQRCSGYYGLASACIEKGWNGRLIAAPGGNVTDMCAHSDDGINWVKSNANSNGTNYMVYTRGIQYVGNDTWVMINNSNQFTGATKRPLWMSTDNGVNWAADNSQGFGQSVDLMGISDNGQGTCVIVGTWGGSDKIMYTTDSAQTWTTINSPENIGFTDVTWGGNIFVAIGRNPNTSQCLWSYDGITWQPEPSSSKENWNCIAYHETKQRFIAVAEGKWEAPNCMWCQIPKP